MQSTSDQWRHAKAINPTIGIIRMSVVIIWTATLSHWTWSIIRLCRTYHCLSFTYGKACTSNGTQSYNVMECLCEFASQSSSLSPLCGAVAGASRLPPVCFWNSGRARPHKLALSWTESASVFDDCRLPTLNKLSINQVKLDYVWVRVVVE